MEWGVNNFHHKQLSGFFCAIKSWNQIYHENSLFATVTQETSYSSELRIWDVWFGEWGGLGFENRNSVVIYVQTISMNHLCSKCKWEQNVTQRFVMKSRYPETSHFVKCRILRPSLMRALEICKQMILLCVLDINGYQ